MLLELDHCIADELEDQDLDFKQWDMKSRDKAVRTIERQTTFGKHSRLDPPPTA